MRCTQAAEEGARSELLLQTPRVEAEEQEGGVKRRVSHSQLIIFDKYSSITIVGRHLFCLSFSRWRRTTV